MGFAVDESPAVEALGPLFKLTEVHLWDDGTGVVRGLPYQGASILTDKDFGRNHYSRINGFSPLPEDVELAEKMNALGLPLSFHTSKKRNATTSGKRKGTGKSNHQISIELDDFMLDPIEVNEDESSLLNSSELLDQREISRTNSVAAADVDLSIEAGDSVSSSACTSTVSNGEISDRGFSSGSNNYVLEEANQCLDGGASDGSCSVNEGADSDSKEINEGTLVIGQESECQSNNIGFDVVQEYASVSEQNNSNLIDVCGEWMAYWDDFHTRTYFYNVETEESTWDPPSGMGHLVYGTVDDVATSQRSDEIEGNWFSAENFSSTVSTKKKGKVRRTRPNRKVYVSSEGVLEEVPASISKYWCQRYLLFSRFDDGIKMDEEGWFSVTPEPLAKHHAARCGDGAIVDFFTGVGGNAIQFAQWSKHVIAIDIDPNKIELARHNAAIYGVDDNIDFVKGDSFALAPKLKADTVFMSPPWGGPAYSKVKKFDIYTMLRPRDGRNLFNAGKMIAPKIVMFLPRNVDINQLAELSLSANPPWSLEVERNFMNGRLKAVTAYFSEGTMS